ncbi:DMT family transporter [Benzoatithermus flavus]|uniref:DMT family transporter n=1 Tax=Benzoatithermus flavus TaxID=3108223 RepID=A0ABU8XQS7_9PROT
MQDSRGRSTLAGLGAIGLWALLAPLGVAAGPVPPFLLTGLAFAVGGVLGLAWQLGTGRGLAVLGRVPPVAWVLGIGAFFGYHALYFTALQTLPPVEALLIINLWPLLIVLFTGLLPGERLLPLHLVGVTCGLLGAAILVLSKSEPAVAGVPAPSLPGYLAAVGCALIWSGYSVLNRRLVADVPSDAVTGFCLVTAVLALLAHALLEPAVWPEGAAWLAVLLLGLGPVGAAFFLWDHGTKHGRLQVLGAAAYLAPLLGTLLLLLMGRGQPSLGLLAAAVLIVGGAVLAGRAKAAPAEATAALSRTPSR